MAVLTRRELNIWLAALIDGEGSIMFSRRIASQNAKVQRNLHYRAVITIATADFRLMEALIQRTGIRRVYQHRVSGDPRTPMKRAQWTWRLTSQDIQKWLPGIRPHLVLKGEQADLLLEALRIKNTITPNHPDYNHGTWTTLCPRLHEIHAEIRRLNRHGRETQIEYDRDTRFVLQARQSRLHAGRAVGK